LHPSHDLSAQHLPAASCTLLDDLLSNLRPLDEPTI
jgi:hypothetical protein